MITLAIICSKSISILITMLMVLSRLAPVVGKLRTSLCLIARIVLIVSSWMRVIICSLEIRLVW